MKNFLQRHRDEILGVLSGFDRIRFRGSLLLFQNEGSVCGWLKRMGIAFKDFTKYAQELTKQLSEAARQLAVEAGRNVEYLNAVVDKEQLVQDIAQERGCRKRPDRRAQHLGNGNLLRSLSLGIGTELDPSADESANTTISTGKTKSRTDPGAAVRLVSFQRPRRINGREWLAKQMDAKGIDYVREDNCFVEIEDFARAQGLANQQLRMDWVGSLNRLVAPCPSAPCPVCSNSPEIDYYWTSGTKPNGRRRGVPRSRRLGSPVPTVGSVMASIRSYKSGRPPLLREDFRPMAAMHVQFPRGQVQSSLKRLQEGVPNSNIASGKTP